MNFLSISRWSPPTGGLRSAIATVAALLALIGSSYGQAQTADPLVARVNGTEIHESDVRVADHELGRSIPIVESDVRREQIIGYLIDTALLSKAALDRNVADEAELQRRVAFARNKGLMENLLTVTARNAITQEAVRKEYHDFVEATGHEPELHLRAITYRFSDPNDKVSVQEAEDKAKAARERIAAGEDFAAVAGETSEDPTVRANGGDLGYRTRPEMGKEYAEAAFTLDMGGVSQPVWTQFGWHLLKVEDRRERKPREFDAVRDSLQGLMARRAQLELVTKLRAEAKIERQGQLNETKPEQGTPNKSENPEDPAK